VFSHVLAERKEGSTWTYRREAQGSRAISSPSPSRSLPPTIASVARDAACGMSKGRNVKIEEIEPRQLPELYRFLNARSSILSLSLSLSLSVRARRQHRSETLDDSRVALR